MLKKKKTNTKQKAIYLACNLGLDVNVKVVKIICLLNLVEMYLRMVFGKEMLEDFMGAMIGHSICD